MRSSVFHRGPRSVVALVALSIGAGCGSEASLVGAECADGFVYIGNQCIKPTKKTLIAPGDPPPGIVTMTPPFADDAGPGISVLDDTVSNVPPVVVDRPIDSPIDPPITLPPIVPPVVTPPECAAPLVACGGDCISVADDGVNCGACGKTCPSNICIDGVCQGATPGDVVLIGHSYATAAIGSSQVKVLVNALLVATSNPVRVLSFEAGASASSVTGAMALATATLAAGGRSTTIQVSGTALDLASPSLAAAYDVVIIHGVAGDAATVGAQWKGSLKTFTEKGGMVVALDDGSLDIPRVLSSAELLAVSGHTKLSEGTHLEISAPADAVGTQVLSPFAAFGQPVSFQGVGAEGPDLAWVLREKTQLGLGDPVVVHRVVRSPE